MKNPLPFAKLLTLCCALFWVNALHAADVNDLTYVNHGTHIEITDCDTAAFGDLVIPDTIEGLPVTVIGDGAFRYCDSLTSITIPDSVTSIGDSAFFYCTYLTSITIPNSVTSIESFVFSDCTSLSSITIPDSVTSIGDYAFAHCDSLTSITIPNSVTSIEFEAFSSCTSLTSAIFEGNAPSTVGSGVFLDTHADFTVSYYEGATGFSEPSWEGYNSSMIAIPAEITYVNHGTHIEITDCDENATGSLVIPAFIEGLPVTVIGDDAFYRCTSLTSITLPETITTIGDRGFINCNELTSINLPNSITSIGGSAFEYCTSLTSITLPNNLTSISDWLLGECHSLTSITIPSSVTSIGDSAFGSCTSLTSAIFEGNAPSTVGAGFFSGAHANFTVSYYEGATGFSEPSWEGYNSSMIAIPAEITYVNHGTHIEITACDINATGSLVIPAFIEGLPVTVIGEAAFWGCSSLTSITLPDTLTTIGERAFEDCHQITSITIPDSVTIIGRYAFSYCTSLIQIDFGNSLTIIEDYAFDACISLEEVTFPASLLSIGYDAFRQGRSLHTVTFNGDAPTVLGNPFEDNRPLLTVYFYEDASGFHEPSWEGYQSQMITTPHELIYVNHGTHIEITDCVSNASGDLVIPALIEGLPVTVIGEEAFNSCSELTSITLPDSVTMIKPRAFSYSNKLIEVTLGNKVESIGERAFEYCDSLTTITFPASLKTLGYAAFNTCESLTKATFEGDAPSSFDSSVFAGTYPTFTVYFYEGATGFTSSTWEGYDSSMIAIPDGLIYGNNGIRIHIQGFDANLPSDLVIPAIIEGLPVTHINANAFESCNTLNSITLPDSLIEIGENAFYLCENLTQVDLGDSLRRIEPGAFLRCISLRRINIPASVVSLRDDIFRDCFSLSSVIFEGNAPLSALTPFEAYLNGYFEIYYYEGATGFATSTTDSQLAGYNPVMVSTPNSLSYTNHGKSIEITDCDTAATGDLIIPAHIDGLPVRMIGEQAFKDCDGITGITFPETITSIQRDALLYCNSLTRAHFQGNAPSFPFGSSMEVANPSFTVYFSEEATGFTTPTWEGANSAIASTIDAPDIPPYTPQQDIPYDGAYFYQVDHVTFIHGELIADYTIPTYLEGLPVTAIATYAFGPDYTSITIPASVTFIEEGAFWWASSLTSIHVDAANPIYSSADGVLFNKDMTTLLLRPQNRAGDYTIPDSVTSIVNSAFWNCTSLTSITIPDSVTSIERYAFSSCSSLTSAIFEGNAPSSFGSNVFSNTHADFTLYYYDGTTGFTSPMWNGYTSVSMGTATPTKGWLVAQGLSHGTDVTTDSNGDGVSLLAEYALGLSPSENNAANMPQPVFNNDKLELTFYAGANDITYTVKCSTDLIDWTTAGITLSAPDSAGMVTASIPVTDGEHFMNITFTEN